MSNIPEALRYSTEHEWVSAPDAEGVVRVGITDFAQDALGDVVYVDLPEVGASVTAESTVGELESTKSVSDLFAPVTGTVIAQNEALEADPGKVNSDPYGEGWLLELSLQDPGQIDSLLDAEGYRQQVG
ncbi:glycine cleavage system protein GcvH [Citricoccus sp. GCM10030269]|uniref:glycine cleavage system protein GcvH n=1 Tax=Citricoccus sp. GCM10030269 TaxID=3273388 RepID=UPI0036231DA0